MLTPHEAKLYLAGLLPERIKYGVTSEQFFWLHRHGLVKSQVLETEWQQIALWVEEKMTDEQWERFDFELNKLWQNAPVGHWSRHRSQATYTTRANAMKESGL